MIPFLLLATSSLVAGIPHNFDDYDPVSSPPHRPTLHDIAQTTKNHTLTTVPTKPLEYTGHSHNPHEAVLVELDEAEILRLMGPDPPSYWEHDTNVTISDQTHGHLMAVHAASMSLAFFGVLPIGESIPMVGRSGRLNGIFVLTSLGIALRAFSSPLHWFVQSIFVGLVVLGWFTGAIYSTFTPSLYVELACFRNMQLTATTLQIPWGKAFWDGIFHASHNHSHHTR